MNAQRKLYFLFGAAMLSWIGCVPPAPLPKPPPPPPVPTQMSPMQKLTDHLVGTWENLEKAGHPRQILFESNGNVTFKGGMEFFNPAGWELRPDQNELVLKLPQADVDKLQIFQMSVNDGVKAFHPNEKEVIYAFSNDIFTLNIGGWTYTKNDQPAPKVEEEPVLK